MALAFLINMLIISISLTVTCPFSAASSFPFMIANSSSYNNSYLPSSHDAAKLSLMLARHEQWMSEVGRVYRDLAEKENRFKIFRDNVEYIESFNTAGRYQYKLGVNEFADLTTDEFCNCYALESLEEEWNINSVHYNKTTNESSLMLGKLTEVDDYKNWIEEGAVSAVREMGHCRSCWAFAAADTIEGINQIRNGEVLTPLSAQQLVDCIQEGDLGGCKGGHPMFGYRFVIDNGGIATYESYPYLAVEGVCDADKKSGSTISSFSFVPKNSESELLQRVAQQPVAVGVDCHSQEFMFYTGGVFVGPCGTDLNHAMTVVGYGDDPSEGTYWLLKNMGGTNWGEDGYMRLKRDVDEPEGTCGLAMYPSYPII